MFYSFCSAVPLGQVRILVILVPQPFEIAQQNSWRGQNGFKCCTVFVPKLPSDVSELSPTTDTGMSSSASRPGARAQVRFAAVKIGAACGGAIRARQPWGDKGSFLLLWCHKICARGLPLLKTLNLQSWVTVTITILFALISLLLLPCSQPPGAAG